MDDWLEMTAQGQSSAADLAEVHRALSLFGDPEDGVTVVGIASTGHGARAHGHTLPGRQVDNLARLVRSMNDQGLSGIYYCLNPVRSTYTSPYGVPKDVDILRRRWLLVDVDTRRPEKTKQGATEAEKALAWQTLVSVQGYLAERDWPAPVVVDSGNGWHLLYRCDLPNDDEAKALVKNWLKHLAARFDNAAADIDTVVYPAKQIAKLPGTWARKGANLPDRPYRLARLVDVPEELSEVVTATMIATLLDTPASPCSGAAYEEPIAETPAEQSAAAQSPFVLTVPPNGRMAAYVREALEAECRVLAACTVGTGLNNQLNRSAFALGQLVGAGVLNEVTARESLYAAALHAGANDPRKDLDTLNRGMEAGKASPRRELPEANGHSNSTPATPAANQDTASPGWGIFIGGTAVIEGKTEDLLALGNSHRKASYQKFEVLSLRQLMALELPEPNWAIAGLLAEGLNMLAGSPKSGKSMLALNLGLTVAGGGQALGNLRTIPGDVLYLSLEDQFRRVQSRARKMAGLIVGDALDHLFILTRWPRMHHGGLRLLGEWVKRVESPRMVIIDVLGKFRPPIHGKGNQYEQDSEAMYALKEFADENRLTVLVLHHTRKLVGKDKDRDEMEDVSGTQGLTGGCDGIMVLKRARQSNDAQVSITGRDDAEQQLAIQFNPETLTWTSLGNAAEYALGANQNKILVYLKARAGSPIFVSEIVSVTDLADNTIRKALLRMMDRGLVRKQGNAWIYPVEPQGESEF